jgi:DNA repair exonuclease SbcCD ATPase subunit
MPDNKQEPNPDGEELEGSRVAELEGLIAERDEALAAKEQRIAELEQALAEKDELEQKLAGLEESLAQAISSYRALIVKYNPGVAEEQIAGDSIEEIDASLASAQALINRVRQELEAEMAAARIPAGAPQRTPADLSALSPRDKIQYAIGERR